MFKKIQDYLKAKKKSRGTHISLFPDGYEYRRGFINKEKYAQEGYIINCIFNACVKKIFNQAITIPLKIVNKNNEEVEHKELQAILDNPNRSDSYQRFLSMMVIDYFVFGDIFIRKDVLEGDSKIIAPQNEKPMSLSILRPFRVKIETDGEDNPIMYKYYNANGESTNYMFDKKGDSLIIHIKTANPLNNIEGVSALESCAISVDQHNMAGAWNVNLLRKGAKLDTVIKANRPLTENEIEEAKANFSRYQSGYKNAGEPIIIDTDIDVEPLGLTPNDMDWLSGYETAMKNICVSLGVPVDLMFGQSTYENLKTANEQLAENTTIPMMNMFINELNKKLVPLYDANLKLYLDIEKMPAMINKKQRQVEALENVSFMTINEKREAIGLEPIEGGDELLVNTTQIPLNDLSDGLSVENE